jgi:hypothetical protein
MGSFVQESDDGAIAPPFGSTFDMSNSLVRSFGSRVGEACSRTN